MILQHVKYIHILLSTKWYTCSVDLLQWVCFPYGRSESNVTAEVTIGVLVPLILVSVLLLSLILIFYKKHRISKAESYKIAGKEQGE